MVGVSTSPDPTRAADGEKRLGTTSYLVLGLLALYGPMTPYDLKAQVSRSVGYFWSFPHSQLYGEPARLGAAGLVTEEREEGGRRRRRFAVSQAGRRAVAAWVAEPVEAHPQIRDLALLKLFFGRFASPGDVAALARVQEAAHRARLAHYEAVDKHLEDHDPAQVEHGRVTLRMGILCEQAFIRFWSEVAERPPS